MNRYGYKAMVLDYDTDKKRSFMFDKLYEGSAFTWEGLHMPDEDEAQIILDWFCDQGFVDGCNAPGYDFAFHRTTGRDFNEKYRLTGDNAYPDDLTIVSMENDLLEIGKMIPIQIKFGARWFDDIVDNNARREDEAV